MEWKLGTALLGERPKGTRVQRRTEMILWVLSLADWRENLQWKGFLCQSAETSVSVALVFDALAEAESNRGTVEDMLTGTKWKATPIQLKKCVAYLMARYVDMYKK